MEARVVQMETKMKELRDISPLSPRSSPGKGPEMVLDGFCHVFKSFWKDLEGI